LSGKAVSKLSDNQLANIRNREIGFVFQGFNLISGLDAQENVELPLTYRGISKQERRRLSAEALERVGLTNRMQHRPSQMSGGQQQRVAIARAIAAKPPIILADEPTGNLDSKSGSAIMKILNELHDEGKTIVLITHDNSIAQSARRTVKIQDGKIV
jgi:putative ABC transport system ATP-binding protein